ncbi:MAG: ribbon-helix-helix protein, CopG family [Terrimicrobiaceae bacterium]
MIYDYVIMRTIIDLPDEQLRGLELWCQRERISRAEAVRRAIGSALSTQSTSPREEAFGAWAHKKVDSRKFVESLRSEWEK